MTEDAEHYDGHCTCGAVRYRMTSRPLFVHCCHCRWCQRETGAAFALNAMIEADRVVLLVGRTGIGDDAFGERQGPEDRALSHLPRGGVEQLCRRRRQVRFVRVGTLAEPDRMPPDIHIFTHRSSPG